MSLQQTKNCYLICLISLFISIQLTCQQETDNLGELSSEDFEKFEEKFRNENNEDEKKYVEPVVRPERFDLNKDRKISKAELRKAINYVIYPKSEKKMKEVTPELRSHVKSNVDLFVQNIKPSHLTLGQFSKVMATISASQFVHEDIVKNKHRAKGEKREEAEGEL